MTGRLPKDLADEVVGSLLDLFRKIFFLVSIEDTKWFTSHKKGTGMVPTY